MDITKIDNLINLYERRINTLKELKSLIENDPGLTSEIIRVFASNNVSLKDKQKSDTSKKASQYDRMVELMNDGHWRTAQEVADAIGAKKSSVAPYFYYETTKNKFEKRNHPDDSRTKQYRLKTELEQSMDNEIK